MTCQARQAEVGWVAVFVGLFSLWGLSVGCARSTTRSSKDEQDKSADAAGDSDNESDASDSLPSSHRSDSGRAVEPRPSIAQDAGRDDTSVFAIECRFDSQCPSDDPCKQGVCDRSGFCSTVLLPDGAACPETGGGPRICLDGVCQISRCGDAFVDRNAGESCEDGNSDTGDRCAFCQVAFCGDGFVQRGVEKCDPLNDIYCKPDCQPIVCGDGVIDEPIENCEPDISEDPCNDECRISDSPEWMVELPPDLRFTLFGTLLVDSSGNPIVVATEADPTSPSIATLIFKYQNNGDQIWSVEFENEASVTAALDNDDNIVVAGSTMEAPSPWIAKVDSQGEDLWSVSPNGKARILIGVATDDDANIMVLAVTPQMPTPAPYEIWLSGTASLEFFSANGDYNSDLTMEIEGSYTVNALNSGAIGGFGRYLVSGAVSTNEKCEPLLTLVESGGEAVWDAPINYNVADERAGFVRAVATSDGDIIALGVSHLEVASTSSFDVSENSYLWLERYSPEGELRWDDRKRVRCDDPLAIAAGNTVSPIAPFTMAIDGDDNIYISAYNSGQNDIDEFILIDKYDPNGEPAWKRPLRHEATGQRLPLGLAVDDSGAIYLLVVEGDAQSIPMPVVPFRHLLYKWDPLDQ